MTGEGWWVVVHLEMNECYLCCDAGGRDVYVIRDGGDARLHYQDVWHEVQHGGGEIWWKLMSFLDQIQINKFEMKEQMKF